MGKLVKIEDEISFSDEIAPKLLQAKPKFRVLLVCLKEGQEIAPHPGDDSMFYIVKGRGIFSTEDGVFDVGPGDAVILENGEKRGIKARESLVILASRASDPNLT